MISDASLSTTATTIGNNVLHLCVINALEEMYRHIHHTAVAIIGRNLRDIYAHNQGLENELLDNIDDDEALQKEQQHADQKVLDSGR